MKSVVVGTAGHIDHGKSALVLALTGTDPDRLKEEKARGITIDLGFAHLTIGDVNLAFVDVPGHERFVKNMLAGVGGIDLVVLVVAADESVMPQTREHVDICRLLRVPAGLVALTKADLVDEDTLELVRLEVRDLVDGSALANAPVIPVSARTGYGLDRLRAALVQAASAVRSRSADGAARLPVDRVFSMKGFGTIATGTLVSGRVRVNDELLVVPGDRRVKVRGIQVHGQSQQEAVAGQRTAVNVGGIEAQELVRGQSLTQPNAFEQTRVADAVLEVLPGAKAIRHGARVRFHQGTSEMLGRIALIGPAAAEEVADDARSELMPPGSRGYVRLRLEGPAVLVRGDGFIVRAYSPPRTIAGGYILDPTPPRAGVRTEAVAARCRRLDFTPGDDRIESEIRAAHVMIDDAGERALPVTALVSRIGVEPVAVPARAREIAARGFGVAVKDTLVSRAVLEGLERRIVATLAKHHHEQPLSEGLAREEARVRLFGRGRPEVFERALDDLIGARAIVGRDRLALPTHHVELSPEAERARERIELAFREGGLTPPDQSNVASVSGASVAIVEQVVRLLQRQKVLVKVDALLFHDEALKRLKEDVEAMKVSGPGRVKIDVSTFKERFGVTRKFAIPLLEYLDRERVTRRVGDERLIL